MSTFRRILGLLFFGVMYRDMMRVGMLMAMGLLLSEGFPQAPLLLISAASIISSFVYANIVNDIYDLDLDREAKSYRPLPSGRYTPGEARAASFAFLMVSILMALLAAAISSSLALLALLLATLFACHYYSGPPLRFKGRSWLGVVSISLIYLAPLVMGLLLGGVAPEGLPVVVLVFLAIFLASGTKDFEDIEVDGSMGVITPPVRYGIAGTARALGYTSVISAALAVVLGGAQLVWGILPQGALSLALVPSFLVYYRRISRYAGDRSRESLLMLVQGCFWVMYVLPFFEALVTLLLLRALLA